MGVYLQVSDDVVLVVCLKAVEVKVRAFMWLNCNIGKVTLETSLAGQRLSPRWAGLCGVAAGSAGASM